MKNKEQFASSLNSSLTHLAVLNSILSHITFAQQICKTISFIFTRHHLAFMRHLWMLSRSTLVANLHHSHDSCATHYSMYHVYRIHDSIIAIVSHYSLKHPLSADVHYTCYMMKMLINT